LEALLLRPSLSVFDAAEAALALVCFAGALVWDSALAAAVFDFTPVDPLLNVLEALLAAFGPVTLRVILFLRNLLFIQ